MTRRTYEHFVAEYRTRSVEITLYKLYIPQRRKHPDDPDPLERIAYRVKTRIKDEDWRRGWHEKARDYRDEAEATCAFAAKVEALMRQLTTVQEGVAA